VIGETGVGKSSFIKYMSGFDSIKISDNPDSVTMVCEIYQVLDFEDFKLIDS
jgi:GTP-binding protein EngB required for normal cell division